MDIKTFDFSSGLQLETPVRIRVMMRDAEPWFVLADVCKAVGLSNPSEVAKRLAPKDRAGITLSSIEGNRGNPYVTIISEAGLYSAIFNTRTNEYTAPFKDWVMNEVLPSIRKTGAYSVKPTITELSRKQILQMALEAEEALEVQLARNAELESAVEVLAPRAEAYTQVIETTGLLSVAEAAKLLEIGETNLFRLLRQWGFLMDGAVAGQENHNVAYQRHIDAKWMTMKASRVQKNGKDFIAKRPFLTGLGFHHVGQRLRTERDLLPLIQQGGVALNDARVRVLMNAKN